MSGGADTKANTTGGGALELGDSRLFEDGSERGGALFSDGVAMETAGEGRGKDRDVKGPIDSPQHPPLPCSHSLSENGLGSEGGAVLAEGLKGNTTLQEL